MHEKSSELNLVKLKAYPGKICIVTFSSSVEIDFIVWSHLEKPYMET